MKERLQARSEIDRISLRCDGRIEKEKATMTLVAFFIHEPVRMPVNTRTSASPGGVLLWDGNSRHHTAHSHPLASALASRYRSGRWCTSPHAMPPFCHTAYAVQGRWP